jgi:Ca2+-binding RTX toxin-like protein
MATITGTANFDFLNGTLGNDSIFGLGGPDTIFGSQGNDFIDGGDGFDAVDYRNIGTGITLEATGIIRKGALGTDQLFRVERIIAPTAFASTIDASTATGTTAVEVNLGGRFINIYNIPGLGFRGFVVENFVNATGTNNNDTFTGSAGNNTLRGLGGDDFFNATAGNDTIDGGSGFDTVDYSPLNRAITLKPTGIVDKGAAGQDNIFAMEYIIGAVNQANTIDASSTPGLTSLEVHLATSLFQVNDIPVLGFRNFYISNFTTVIGTQNADTLDGDDVNNVFNGGGGNDGLYGRGGNDTLIGGAGSDFITGDAGNDRIVGSDSIARGRGEIDNLLGGAGGDRFVLGDRSGSYYKGSGAGDFASVSDFSLGDLIELGVGDSYRAVNRGTSGFDLLAVTGGASDLIARVVGTGFTGIPTGVFSIASGQVLGGVFVGA